MIRRTSICPAAAPVSVMDHFAWAGCAGGVVDTLGLAAFSRLTTSAVISSEFAAWMVAPRARAIFAPFSRMIAVMIGWAASRSEEHTSELQSLMRISYAVFCLKK